MMGGLDAYQGKRILLLQGPVGPFFWRLARDLKWAGAQVCKVNFNGGDWLFYPLGAMAFKGRMEEWPGFLESVLIERKIDSILLLGDCRPIHVVVQDMANKHGVEVGVFEEGYVRPDNITFEKAGVNGYSQIPDKPIFYLNRQIPDFPEPIPVGNTFPYVVMWAMFYYLASTLLWPFFRHYRHHRPLSPLEALPWLRALWRKGYYRLTEYFVEKRLCTSISGDFFLVPLQVHNDAQVRVHSGFASIADFIRYVMKSFADNAPPSTTLVIKHHPLDRGYYEYGQFIRKEAEKLGITSRVLAIHDQHLPTLLAHVRGVVVINSTVGLSAVHHGVPVKVCGSAIYNMQGLTFQRELDVFWDAAVEEKIDLTLYRRFRSYLFRKTQLNGSFYRRLDIPGSHTGLVWRLPDDSFTACTSDEDAVVLN